jgi:MoaA/NifB/PqqE/SkfB family radical SAM enzyme
MQFTQFNQTVIGLYLLMFKKLRKLSLIAKGIIDYNFIYKYRPLLPTTLIINVTYSCNSRCRICNIWKMRPVNELTNQEWNEALVDPIFSNVQDLSISGGEPFLYADLIDFVGIVVKKMPNLHQLNITNNGFLTKEIIKATEGITRMLMDTDIDFSIAVSLDGLGKVHHKMRRIPNAFEKASATIFSLRELQKKYHFSLAVSGVVCHINLSEIDQVEKWCHSNKLSFFYQLVGFHESFVNNIENRREVDFTDNDQQKLISLLMKLSSHGLRRDLRSYPRSYYWKDMLSLYKGGQRTTPCPFLYDAFALGSLGDVYYCLSEKQIGNFIEENRSISDIYFDPQNLEFRRKILSTCCSSCNSGCQVSSALTQEARKMVWFILTGKLGRPLK